MLDLKPKKILEENISNEISDFYHSNIYVDISLQARETMEKKPKNKWNSIKLKNFCTAKETINKMKRQPTNQDNIFANTFDKGLIFKIYKELKKLNTKKIKHSNLKMDKEPEHTIL